MGHPLPFPFGMAMEWLPEALLVEILSRLPVKSLLRFKSVCKNWHTLIQNPTFISLHHDRAASIAAAQNTDCLLVKRYLNGGTLLSIVPKENPVEDIDLSSTGLNIEDLALLGPCNGIVCLTRLGAYSPIVLCNPSMKEFRVLPEPSDKKFFSRDYFVISGYGFDPSTNDCKVVKFGFHGPDFVVSGIREPVKIYELSTDSWREVDAKSDFDFGNFTYSKGASWKGDFYWYARSNIKHRCADAVLVFRMTDEVFDKIPLPEVCSMEHTSAKELFILEDSLALASWMFPMGLFSMEKLFDIWVMDEEGAEVYWTKKFTIGPLEVDFPLGFRRNGEFVFESSGGQIMSYHIDTQQMKEYQVCVHRPQRCYLVRLEVLLYTESLVSIKRHNERNGHDDFFAYLSRLWASLFSTE